MASAMPWTRRLNYKVSDDEGGSLERIYTLQYTLPEYGDHSRGKSERQCINKAVIRSFCPEIENL